MKNKKVKKCIIFDLDGTLYELRGGSYNKSPLKRHVIDNAQKYIATKLSIEKQYAKRVLASIQEKYGEEISIGLEKEYGINRYDYFNTVWNIPANGVVKKKSGLREVLASLRGEYMIILVSDAPRVWIDSVIKELQVEDIFLNNIFSGEGNHRKGFDNAYSWIVKELGVLSANCIAVGDQDHTDIIPAKKLGMHTVFVHRTKTSLVADVCIKSIRKLPTAIEDIKTRR